MLLPATFAALPVASNDPNMQVHRDEALGLTIASRTTGMGGQLVQTFTLDALPNKSFSSYEEVVYAAQQLPDAAPPVLEVPAPPPSPVTGKRAR